MKKLLILLLLVPSLSWGADFEKGLTAANQGDYANTIEEFKLNNNARKYFIIKLYHGNFNIYG